MIYRLLNLTLSRIVIQIAEQLRCIRVHAPHQGKTVEHIAHIGLQIRLCLLPALVWILNKPERKLTKDEQHLERLPVPTYVRIMFSLCSSASIYNCKSISRWSSPSSIISSSLADRADCCAHDCPRSSNRRKATSSCIVCTRNASTDQLHTSSDLEIRVLNPLATHWGEPMASATH